MGTGFHPELTGRENIYLNGAILGMRRTEIRSRFDEIVAFAETAKPAHYGTFCPLVFDADANGDATASQIIDRAVQANLRILRKLSGFGAKRIALMGGLAEHMGKRMPRDIVDQLVPAKYDAMHGAILLAKQRERTPA